MYLEAFCRVLSLLVEMCGLAASNLFRGKRKRLLAAVKNFTLDGYLALQKT